MGSCTPAENDSLRVLFVALFPPKIVSSITVVEFPRTQLAALLPAAFECRTVFFGPIPLLEFQLYAV